MKKSISPKIKLLIIIIIAALLLHRTRFIFFSDFYSCHLYSLNRQRIKLKPGEKFQLRINGFNVRCKYSSSNFRIAYVNFAGTVYAVQKGHAVITADMSNGISEKCHVTVTE